MTVVGNGLMENAEISLTLFLRRNRVVLGIILTALNITLIVPVSVYILCNFNSKSYNFCEYIKSNPANNNANMMLAGPSSILKFIIIITLSTGVLY